MNSMGILHVTRTLHPVECPISRLAAMIAAAQAAAGCRVCILTEDNAQTMVLAEKAFEAYDGFNRVRIIHAHDRDKLGYFLGSHAIEQLPGLLAKADILHVHGVWEVFLHRAARMASRRRIPVVVSPHGLRNAMLEGALRPFQGLLLSLGWKTLLRRAALLHALDEDEENTLGRMGFKDRVRVVADSLDMGNDLIGAYPAPACA